MARLAPIGVLREVRPQLFPDRCPRGTVDVSQGIGGCERHVVIRPTVVSGLVDEQEPVEPVDIVLVRREDARALTAAERAASTIGQAGGNLLLHQAPLRRIVLRGWQAVRAFEGVEQIRALLETHGHVQILVLVEAVVDTVLLGDADIDRAPLVVAVHVDPRLGLREGHEVVGDGIHHAVVGRSAAVVGVGRRMQVRCPVDDVLADLVAPEGLRCPSVAGIVRRHLHMALFRPVDKIIRFPDLEVERAVRLRAAKASLSTCNLQIGSQHVEPIAVMRPHDERVSQPLFTKG